MNKGFYEFSRGRQETTSSVFPYTGSAIISGSLIVTGSVRVSQGITGSLFGTSSWATNAVTASYITSSNVFGPFGANSILSASFAISSSRAVTSSFAISSSFATSASFAVSSSRAVSSSFAISASWAPSQAVDTSSLVTTASFNTFTSSYNTGSFTGSFRGDGSGLTNLPVQNIDTSSLVTTASFNAFTSSYNTGSFTGSFTGTLIGTSSWATNAITATIAGNGGVTQLLAGSGINLSPTNGLGQVTVIATAGGGSSFNTATGSYGSFYSTSSQTNPVANIPRSMSLDHTDITNGVSISGSTNPFNTYIKTENAGVYNIQFSAQVEKTDSGTDEIVIWLRKNGIDLTDTATTITLTNNNTKVVAAWNWFVTSAANDYYQIIWISTDTGMRLLAETISGTHPGIPSVIVTANRVDQFLSNTGSFSGSFTGQFTGSLFGTASFASTASFVQNAQSASYILQAVSSSFATTASFVQNAQSASYVLQAVSSSFALTASYAMNGGGGGSGGTDLGLVQAMVVGLQNIF